MGNQFKTMKQFFIDAIYNYVFYMFDGDKTVCVCKMKYSKAGSLSYYYTLAGSNVNVYSDQWGSV